jgi:hypothetical protein
VVNVSRGPQANIGQSVESGAAHTSGEFPTELTGGPATQITDHNAMPAAFGGDIVESVKGSAPGATAGVPAGLDPLHTHSLHKRLAPFDMTNPGNARGRNV